MNLSKTEKLLAAKKKLKEFQLSKMMHDSTIKQNDLPEPQVNQCPNVEIKMPEVPAESNKGPVEIIQNSGSSFNHGVEINDASAIRTENNPPVECTNLFVSNSVVTSNNSLEKYSASGEDAGKTFESEDVAGTIGKEEFPMVQKEHLLEMASEVAHVLTNNSDAVESSMESELAYRNQFVNSYLEEQKRLVNGLHLEVSTYRDRIAELERELATKDADFRAQLAREVNPLREQLQAHAQTTGILIAEKAELTAALAQTQQTARQSAEEAEELSGKLKSSQVRISELEKEVATLRTNNEEVRKNSQQLRNDYEALEQRFFDLRKEKEELSLEASELKQKLNLKRTELVSTQQELQEKTTLLSLSELRIQQMKDTTQTDDKAHGLLELEQELNRTKAMVTALNEEKDAANKQYQNYIRQLDTRQAKLLSEIQSQSKIIEDLGAREQSYVQRLSELEQQLQQEREKTETLLPLQDRKEEVENLLKNIDELTLEQERLHIALAEKDSQIEALTKEVRELQEAHSQTADVSKLATALESEQLGASRAVSQNQQLKQQLTEMENAFVSLSNAKLDLTEQLQAERSVGKKLNAMLNKVESEIEDLREKLREKEAALHELEKERLQNAQIADQMQHYQAQSQHAHTFQQELHNALVCIDRLEKEKQELLDKLNEKKEQETIVQNDPSHHNGDADAIRETEDDASSGNTEDCDSLCNSVPEPIKKLEERFKETMERVAELTEEKQRLEHLVLQLQSETETIGEYIELYQKQRAVLQNRARERETAFRQLLEQRNQQQEQLHKMKVLVSDFLTKQFIAPNGPTDYSIDSKEINADDASTPKGKIDEEATETTLTDKKSLSELLDLLTEIKECKDSCIFEPNFHPCPWCSGKLITV